MSAPFGGMDLLMRRNVLFALVLALLAGACGDDAAEAPAAPAATAAAPTSAPVATTAATGAPTTTTVPTTTVPTTTAPTTTVAPTTTTPPPTTTEVPIEFDPDLTERTWAVVLVDLDHVLNVRVGPGVENDKLTSFGPTQTGIVLTGQTAQIDGSKWVEVQTEDARGWVNSFFLTEEWTTREVGLSWDMQTPLDDLTDAMAVAGDLSDPVSARGLFVVYFDTTLRRWPQSELDTVMTDPTTYDWATPGCEGDCIVATFADAVALRLLDAYEDVDDDAIVGLDDILLGGNGPFPPETAIPTQFQNFHWVVIYDPGDDPLVTGLDWQTWFVYYDYEEGQVKIVALSPAAGSP